MNSRTAIYTCLFCIGLIALQSDISAQKRSATKSTSATTAKKIAVDWVKVNEMLTYKVDLLTELCCDCGPKTIEDLLVGSSGIDNLIQSACKLATDDMGITREMEFIKIKVSEPDAEGLRSVDVSNGNGEKLTIPNATLQLVALSSKVSGLASEAQKLLDAKDAAQKDVEDASMFKKISYSKGFTRGVDITQTVISETKKQADKLANQINALKMLKDY